MRPFHFAALATYTSPVPMRTLRMAKKASAIVDIERPESPRLDQMYNDGESERRPLGEVAMTNASLYAYVADGKNGLRVLQLTDRRRCLNTRA